LGVQEAIFSDTLQGEKRRKQIRRWEVEKRKRHLPEGGVRKGMKSQ